MAGIQFWASSRWWYKGVATSEDKGCSITGRRPGLDRWGARWEKAKEGVQVSCGVTGWMGGPFTKEGIDSGKGTA